MKMTKRKTPKMGKMIKIKLIQKDMTQSELAKELGITYANLNGFINGRHSSLKVEMLLLEWLR